MDDLISASLRREIFNAILSLGNLYGKYDEGIDYEDLNKVDFLNLIWDLGSMQSEDTRFKNAQRDAFQHLVLNDDWDVEYTFVTRFNLLTCNSSHFIKFLEAVVSPMTRTDEVDIKKYVGLINSYLTRIDAALIRVGYIDNKSQYRYRTGKDCKQELPDDIQPNSIKVFVQQPDEYPCFKLVSRKWDDFGYKTSFSLFYYYSQTHNIHIGDVKILALNQRRTLDSLPKSFTNLSSNFISLGQSLSYYSNIHRLMQSEYRNFLFAMKDVALFSSLLECSDFREGFQLSLLRDLPADKAFQFAKYQLAGYNFEDPLSFIFKTSLPYHESPITIRFNFGNLYQHNSFSRIIALIGNNGLGKTTILNNLADALTNANSVAFQPRIPMYSKVMASSYSLFDRFFHKSSTSFNYQYCGIKNADGGVMAEEEIKSRRGQSLRLIQGFRREAKLIDCIREILGRTLCDAITTGEGKIDEEKFEERFPTFSSGQTMLLNMIIEMIAHIRLNTLLLIDEPEVHLHPKAISKMIRIIYTICEEFKSCCILATHSSLIVQELLAKNIIIIDQKEDGAPYVRPMRIESMGESLTVINNEVFGNNETPLYLEKLHTLVEERGRNLDLVLDEIENQEIPLNTPLYMYLDKMCSKS